jgi:phosphatidylglycerophosphatase C
VTRNVAAFDFDGTLTRRDTMLPFLSWAFGTRRVVTALAAASRHVAAVAAGRSDRDLAKEAVLIRVLRGRPHAEVAEAGRAFGARLARHAITADMSARLAWHRARGHDLVIVSASLDVYVDEVARLLGFMHTASTALEVADGMCTGRIEGRNCRGPEKAVRLRALLGDNDAEIWAYGNSSGDRDMLALADHPVWVRRGRLPTRNA